MTIAYPFTAFRFEVQLKLKNPQDYGLPDTLCDAAFAECDGLEMSMEPKTIREGGNNTAQIHLVGPVSYGNLSLKRGMTQSLDLWRWFSVAVSNQGRGVVAQGIVTMRDAADKVQVRFKITDCLPIKLKAPALNAKEGLVAIEEMQIAYKYFTVELP